MFKTITVLLLTAVFILSLILQNSFSYTNFIPRDFGFGFNIYCVFMIFLLLIGERLSEGKYITLFPLFSVITSTILFFIILHYFEPGISGGHGGGNILILFFIVGVNIGILIYGGLRVEARTVIIKIWNSFDQLVKKYFVVTISVLTVFIFSINTLIFYDYTTKGVKLKLSDKNNLPALLDEVVELNDISRCEFIASNYKHTVDSCFSYFFNNNIVINGYHNSVNNTGAGKHDFYSIYYALKENQCARTKFTKKCENNLLLETTDILEKEIEKYFSRASPEGFYDVNNNKKQLRKYYNITSKIKASRLISKNIINIKDISSVTSVEVQLLPPNNRYGNSNYHMIKVKLDMLKLIENKNDLAKIAKRIQGSE